MSKLLRVRCPKCGTVLDLPGDGQCWKCHTLIASCGGWRCYMEVYLNGIRLGTLKYEDVTRIPVPYGHYQVIAKFLDRKVSHYKGQGVEFDVTPQNRIVFLKAARCIPGYATNTVILEQAFADEMKPL